ncbi:hypothetical protein CPC08DRAFT_632135 [Agrocybe pediades]|nr:hypothetical protein CPC08DRAFT_632135 [Agrocybe pediades]
MSAPNSTESTSSPNKSKSTTMPPGMVMGPDGKPCKICTSFRNWKPRTTNNTTPRADREPKVSTSEGQQKRNGTPVASSLAGDEPPPGCPPDVEQLGRATWTFLHTTAAYYPEKPTPTQSENMLMLLRSIPVLYPCTWCAKDFGEDIGKNPPDVSGRTALSLWLCKRHNEVNEKLGKESFDCAKVDERWKDGPADGRCD